MQLKLEGPFFAEVAARVHSRYEDQKPMPFGVLWTRKIIQQSPLATHITNVKEKLYGPGLQDAPGDDKTCESALKLLIKEARNISSGTHSSDLVDMTENALELLREIMEARGDATAPSEKHALRKVTARQVSIGDDAVMNILRRARAGANGNCCTKSKVAACTSPAYAEVLEQFGLQGVAAYPVFLGSWWAAHLLGDFDDWRQDYLAILDYSFFFEYNVDKVVLGQSSSALMKEILALWDMPGLSHELRVRRAHMLISLSFFDLKRTHESAFHGRKTDGLTVWVHASRDLFRDFKALDSGCFAHYLSFAPGVAGRDDMMLSGLVNDWVDLGPDLRYQECNQSVFALTRGSLALDDLVRCYERTVWMLNASFVSDQRHVGCMAFVASCVWELINHRQDVWRYYSLAYDVCSALEPLNLDKIANLAECYTTDLKPRKVPDANELSFPYQTYPYLTRVNAIDHEGLVMLPTELCDSVASGLLPKSVIDYQVILPHLLRQGEIGAEVFLSHMDGHYCAHTAAILRSGHRHNFCRPYGRALAALIMHQWRSGLFFAMGIGSLVDATADYIANDRLH
ncbi:hypothetical protein XA68_10992 [Ophiocordyceps unilateralis]|uniref:Uncharacterized protein n=1 Tax=Ophiocordyceps unilateralis TaxID=268505 RepID=A0A2A9PNI8_OPHUN|nr:hypothetical protein XA68_10992 [Ophiocordyceps unilateralis]